MGRRVILQKITLITGVLGYVLSFKKSIYIFRTIKALSELEVY